MFRIYLASGRDPVALEVFQINLGSAAIMGTLVAENLVSCRVNTANYRIWSFAAISIILDGWETNGVAII